MAKRLQIVDVMSRYSGLRPTRVDSARTRRVELPPRELPDVEAHEDLSSVAVLYTVGAGDRIDLMAASLLGDSRRWFEIADLNPGLDPLILVPGQQIFVPKTGES